MSTVIPSSEAHDRCLNCGEPLTGRFCTKCGQDHRHRTLTIRSVIGDFSHQIVAWEWPLLRTVGDMLWRPGHVASEYVRGRRQAYTNPLKFCFITGAMAVATAQFLPGAAEIATGAQNLQENAEAARPILEWYGRWLHLLYFFTLPLMAGMMRLTFWRGGRSFVECLVLCLFVLGEVFLIQLMLMPLVVYVNQAFGILSLAAALGYFGWGAATFFNGRKWILAPVTIVLMIVYSHLIVIGTVIVGVVLLGMLGHLGN